MQVKANLAHPSGILVGSQCVCVVGVCDWHISHRTLKYFEEKQSIP